MTCQQYIFSYVGRGQNNPQNWFTSTLGLF